MKVDSYIMFEEAETITTQSDSPAIKTDLEGVSKKLLVELWAGKGWNE